MKYITILYNTFIGNIIKLFLLKFNLSSLLEDLTIWTFNTNFGYLNIKLH